MAEQGSHCLSELASAERLEPGIKEGSYLTLMVNPNTTSALLRSFASGRLVKRDKQRTRQIIDRGNVKGPIEARLLRRPDCVDDHCLPC